MKFKTMHSEIEAFQFFEDMGAHTAEIPVWFNKAVFVVGDHSSAVLVNGKEVVLRSGDFVCRDGDGEIFVCSEAAFVRAYIKTSSAPEPDDGGPAFPQHGWTRNPEVLHRMQQSGLGMTLRDYFAAKAMQAEIITTFSDATPHAAENFLQKAAAYGRTPLRHLAHNSYDVADEMIAARQRGATCRGAST